MAVVTGASSGIGAAIAWELAKQGFNLFLVARRVDVLQEMAGKIQAKYKNQTFFMMSDLYKSDSAFEIHQETINIAKVQNLTPSILINNAGIGQ